MASAHAIHRDIPKTPRCEHRFVYVQRLCDPGRCDTLHPNSYILVQLYTLSSGFRVYWQHLCEEQNK